RMRLRCILSISTFILACGSSTEPTRHQSLSGAWIGPTSPSSSADSIVIALEDSTPRILGFTFVEANIGFLQAVSGVRTADSVTLALGGQEPWFRGLYDGWSQLNGIAGLPGTPFPITIHRFPPPPPDLPGR